MRRFVGESARRVEDPRILTGRGRYVDDVRLTGMLHATFLRSAYPHARVGGIDVEAARQLPGVVAVFTGAEIAPVTKPIQIGTNVPGFTCPEFWPLATDRVRFVGDPVAIVVAENRYVAEDACDLIDVEYEPLDPVVSFETAQDPGLPPLFEDVGENVIYRVENSYGDVDSVFASAHTVIRETFHQSRQANVPMETRGAVADYNPASRELTFHASTQNTHGWRFQLANYLDQPLERVRVLCGDVGGGFGLKLALSREDLTLAAASRIIGRPIKWIEDRNEHLLASGHAREERMEVEAAVSADGLLVGLRARMLLDQGAYPSIPTASAIYLHVIRDLLPGPYRMQALAFEGACVVTNKASMVAYRGPWEIETWVRERLIDLIARELDLDRIDVRRRNLVDGAPEDRSITGSGLDGISSRQCLDLALEKIGYAQLVRDKAAARETGRLLGIGIATYIEFAPGWREWRSQFSEAASARIEPNGHLVVYTGQGPTGQGHETTLAQIAADALGVPLDHVRVVHGDTSITPLNLAGTGGSRAGTWASGSVMMATKRVREKALAVASAMLEIDAADLDIVDGMVTPRGVPSEPTPLAQVANTAYLAQRTLPADVDPHLAATETFTAEGISGSGWSGGTHVCLVEVDLETGGVRILRYLVAEDAGQIINPAIVDGQIRGGVAQGIAGVLYERAAYDADGQFLAGTFMDYLLPTASEIPFIEIVHYEGPPPGEGVEFRGVGEGGAIVAPAVVTSAIEDALGHLGVRVTEQYLPPGRILELAGVVAVGG